MKSVIAARVLLCTLAATVTATTIAAAPAHAQEAAISERRAGPLALVATLGWYDGAAVGGELGLGPVGARLTGGGNLTMLTVSDADTHDIDSFHAFATAQANADLYAYPVRLDNGLELGLSAGARYNTLLGTGFGGALEARRQLGPRLGLRAALGFTVFPDGEDRIVAEEDFPPDADFNFPLGAGFQSGLQVALTYDLL
jgi:hypothetical protein